MVKTEQKKLTQKQLEYLEILIPWAWDIETQSELKMTQLRGFKRAAGFSAILFACTVILKTNWGEHPLSKEKIKGKESNNLLLLPTTPWWEGRVTKYDGLDYKAFENWEEFCIHFSDLVVFSKKYDQLLVNSNYLSQIKLYCDLTDDNLVCYSDYIKLLKLLGIKSEQD